MTPEQIEALNRLEAILQTLNDNFFTLIAHCETDAQKRQVVDANNLATANYVNALTGILNANDAELETLLKAGKQAKADVDSALSDLGNFKASLNAISSAVHEVAKIVAFLPA